MCGAALEFVGHGAFSQDAYTFWAAVWLFVLVWLGRGGGGGGEPHGGLFSKLRGVPSAKARVRHPLAAHLLLARDTRDPARSNQSTSGNPVAAAARRVCDTSRKSPLKPATTQKTRDPPLAATSPTAQAALDQRERAAADGDATEDAEDVRAPLPTSSRLIISLMAYTFMDLYSGVLHINLDQVRVVRSSRRFAPGSWFLVFALLAGVRSRTSR